MYSLHCTCLNSYCNNLSLVKNRFSDLHVYCKIFSEFCGPLDYENNITIQHGCSNLLGALGDCIIHLKLCLFDRRLKNVLLWMLYLEGEKKEEQFRMFNL